MIQNDGFTNPHEGEKKMKTEYKQMIFGFSVAILLAIIAEIIKHPDTSSVFIALCICAGYAVGLTTGIVYKLVKKGVA